MSKERPFTLAEASAWCWIGIAMLIALLHNGIFVGIGIHNIGTYKFESPLYYTMLLSAVILLWVITHIISKKHNWAKSWWLSAGSFVMPLVYLLSSVHADTGYLAEHGVLIHIVWFIFFLAGTVWIQHERLIQWFPSIYAFFGYLVLIFGFACLFGNTYLLDAVVSDNEQGVRMASVFQYANALAVLLLTVWFTILIELNRVQKKWLQMVHGMMLVPVCSAFLLTLSRGALVILPVIAIVMIAMFRLKQQIMMIIYSIVGMALSLLIYSQFTNRGTEVLAQIQQSMAQGTPFHKLALFSSASFSSWAYLVGATLVMGILVYLLQKYVEPALVARFGNVHRKWNHWILPLSLIVITVLAIVAVLTDAVTRLLPTTLRTRVEDMNWQTHSVYERLTMYKDALKVWREHPVFGGGAGAWEAVYQKYQSYSYISAQTHSFITQLLVETGIVGLVAVLLLIVGVIALFAKRYARMDESRRNTIVFYFLVPVTILLHSMIDFEMSFLFFGLLVCLCLGVISSLIDQPVAVKLSPKNIKWAKWSTVGVLTVVGIVFVVMTSIRIYVHDQMDRSIRLGSSRASLDQVLDPIQNGLKKDPNNPLLLYQNALWNYQAFQQSKDQKYLSISQDEIAKLVKAEPHYFYAYELEFAVAMSAQNNVEALSVIQEALHKAPFQQHFYELEMNLLASDWSTAFSSESVSERTKYYTSMMDLYHQMQEKVEIQQNLPSTVVPQPFVISSNVLSAVGEVNFYEGKYADAVEIMRPGLAQIDLSRQESRTLARFYIASLRKSGQDDLKLYQKLVKTDPSEAQQVDRLINNS